MDLSALLHPGWDRPPQGMTDGFSLEITAADCDALAAAAPLIPPETPIAITWLPGEAAEARIAAARLVRGLGFEPMPHFSARRIRSEEEFRLYLAGVVAEAGVRRAFVIAGDPSAPEGPFADSAALIRTGAFEAAGLTAIGLAGHPEGHPAMSADQCHAALAAKCVEVAARGMAPLVVTQFAFDAAPVLRWLEELRARGIEAPVRIGVPGPAGIRTLLRFAARCGVGASGAVLAKYGIGLGRLVGTAGPDRFVDALAERLGPQHGLVRLHFYPFGGLERTAEWIGRYAAAR